MQTGPAHSREERVLCRLASGNAVATTLHRYGAGEPTVFVGAAQHGRELNGAAAVRDLHDRLVGADLRGSVVCVPVLNPLAFDHRTYMVPERLDAVNSNMNRVWPGDPDGTLVERMAAGLWEVVGGVDAVVDLHTGGPDTLEHVVYTDGDDRSRDLAGAFDVELLVAESGPSSGPGTTTDEPPATDGERPAGDERFTGEARPSGEERPAGERGKLRAVAAQAGIPAVTPELASRDHIDRAAVELGVEGTLNVLRTVGVLPGDPGPADGATVADRAGAVTADRPGTFRRAGPGVGDRVGSDTVLGRIDDPVTYERRATVEAEAEGVLYTLRRDSTTLAGEKLADVAVPR